MHSKYNYSPSTASLRFNKSTSNEKFYRQATQRTQIYESTIQSPPRDCLACRHEQQIPAKANSNRPLPQTRPLNNQSQLQDYYPQSPDQQMDNLRKSKRFLEELLERNKRDYRAALTKNEEKIIQLQQQLEEKNHSISNLERKINANQLLQQYASASMVGTYVNKQDGEEKQILHAKIKEQQRALEKIQNENEALKAISAAAKTETAMMQSLQQRVKQCEIYAREYESMKLLIHKMQLEKQETLKKHEKNINQMMKRQKEEIHKLYAQIEEVKNELQQKNRQIQGKGREIEKTRLATEEATHTQWEHLLELLQEKNEEVDRLQSKLSVIESQLTFLKNRYGYLLKLTKNNQEVTSNTDLDDYCIQRVGRHNLSNGKESLIGLNLSPIKRR